MNDPAIAPYESPRLRRVMGPTLRPGGLDLTLRVLDKCDFSAGDRVLDLGCGLGASAGHMAGKRNLSVLGLDISAAMLSETRQACKGLPLVRAEAGALPLAADSLDGVVCECVLSLTRNPGLVLAECCRVLRPGGLLVLSDIYLRNPEVNREGPLLPGCLGGALGRAELEALTQAAGLEVLLWEDHSSLLRELAAQLAWTYGSTEALWGVCGQGEDCRTRADRAAQTRPGYFLMKAQRKAEDLG